MMPQLPSTLSGKRTHIPGLKFIFRGLDGWIEPTAGQPAIERLEDESASRNILPGAACQSVSNYLVENPLARIDLHPRRTVHLRWDRGCIFIVPVAGGEMWYLQLIPSHEAISWIYSHLERISARLLPGLPNGHTPHQLQIALIQKLKSAKNRSLRIVFSSVEFEIESVVTLYMALVFSQQPPGKSQIIRGIRSWDLDFVGGCGLHWDGGDTILADLPIS